MKEQDVGASVPDRAGGPTDPSPAVSAKGAHPSRVRVILDCDWKDLQHALDMVIETQPDFAAIPSRIGWGWQCYRRGKPSIFVRLTKRGYSATADRSDT